jgi:DNA-binding LacI/PurR family transcriptional regulator
MNFCDLARQLNVSTATVSRALSHLEKVAPATRKRVLEFVQRSGYYMMAGALHAICQRRVKVPRDLSLVGFDDARWAQYSDPPLTVVSQPTEQMGQKAAELLLGSLKGERCANTVVFEPQLIVRRSTGAPKRG